MDQKMLETMSTTYSCRTREENLASKLCITVHYTNYRGESGIRRIIPLAIRWGTSEWHKNEQWLMEVFDVVKVQNRTFALAEMTMFGHSGIERAKDEDSDVLLRVPNIQY